MGRLVFCLPREPPGFGDVVSVLFDHGFGKFQAPVRAVHGLRGGRLHLQFLRPDEKFMRGGEETQLDRVQLGGFVDPMRLPRLLARSAGVAIFQRCGGLKENLLRLLPEPGGEVHGLRTDRFGTCIQSRRE